MKLTMVSEGYLPFDETDIMRSIGMDREHRFKEPIRRQLEMTRQIAAPKGFFLECDIDAVAEETVVVEGQTLTSPTLVRLLGDTKKVYPFLSTCGEELAAYALTCTDMVEKFALDAIMNFYQKQAAFAVESAVLDRMPRGYYVNRSTPGDLPDWDIREQKKLFNLFGDAAAEIGVRLKDNYLMTPLKTVAGLWFAAPDTKRQCRHCAKLDCIDRREPFDGRIYWRSNLYIS